VTLDVKRWDLICHEGLITHDAVRKEKLDSVRIEGQAELARV